MKNLISIIIPAYNEEKVINDCLVSLSKQSYKPIEIIVVDDGSKDKTVEIARKQKIKVLSQNHRGPGQARNLGASKSKGEILVFIDSDMTFEKDFIKDLTLPILKKETIGTFSKNEMNANYQNIWSSCWNINRNWPIERLIPPNSPDTSPVFRAILKSEFNKVKGFDLTGEYTDDWSLSQKLNAYATVAPGATYYHSNPDSLAEVWKQAQWFSTNKFLSGSLIRKIKSVIFYSLPVSLIIGFYKSAKNKKIHFLVFKTFFDFAVWTAILKSFISKNKAK